MKSFHTTTEFTGTVVSVSPEKGSFMIEPLTKEAIEIQTSITTSYEVLKNISDLSRDRVIDPQDKDVEKLIGKADKAVSEEEWKSKRNIIKYIKMGTLVCIEVIYSVHDNIQFYLARKVVLMHSTSNEYGWEETHWWIQQDNTLFEQWLDVLFGSKREITENDIAEFYRTNLDMLGGITLSSIQESATLSRFLYGLSSAYLLTGNERAFSAAKACASYIVNAYSNGNHDERCMFWKFGRVQDSKSTREILGSDNEEDRGTYALYEQIYVLSGLTQYYRITQDTYILSYITRTIAAFERYFRDAKENGIGYDDKTKKNADSCYLGLGGYFSHIDPITMRPDSPSLKENTMRKNWNSIGDHIPAYLVNLIVSIDPIPVSKDSDKWKKLLDSCRDILQDCVGNILKYFPPEVDEKDEPTSLFVNERFMHDWTPDHSWGWQQDRGIVGHNLKISWNLTRCAHYFNRRAKEIEESNENNKIDKAKKLRDLADRSYKFSFRLGNNMKIAGVDLLRGGIFDALERHPKNGLPTQFAWGATKDFWQQEQAILAYYIMQHVAEGEEKKDFLELARYSSAFWSRFFVDHDYRKIFFRTSESGTPIRQGHYGIQAGHAIAGYHAFELGYLAHIYIKTYVVRDDRHHDNFILHYRPNINSEIKTLNVMPDFFRPEDLKIIGYKINGVSYEVEGLNQFIFQIPIQNLAEDSIVTVEYLPIRPTANTDEELQSEKERVEPFQISYKK